MIRSKAYATLILLGLAAIARGTWIPVKATLAQILLRSSWQRTLAGANDTRPWPWADTRPVARIVIERTGSDFIVLEGANGSALAFAPGHLEHTALPGSAGNCVISAHRDTHFAALRDLVRGDVVRVQGKDGRWFRYRVDAYRVVDRKDTWITKSHGAPTLTLVTCYPFDAVAPGGPQRYVISARRDEGPSSALRQQHDSSESAWKRALKDTLEPRETHCR